MNKALALTGTVCLALGCLSLGACAASGKSMQIAQAPAGMHQVTALYEKATASQRRMVRKPVRDARARAMRSLAAKADAMVAETEAWDGEARLAGIEEPARDEVRTTVVAFRNAMRDLESAARKSNVNEVRASYAAAKAAYARLNKTTD